MNDNIYTKSIRLGFSNMKSGVSFCQLINFLNQSDNLNFEQDDDIVINIFLDVFSFSGSKEEFIRNYPLVKDNRYQVKLDSYLKLIQHDEYQRSLQYSNIAVRNSNTASKIAIWSIIISGLIGIATIILSITSN